MSVPRPGLPQLRRDIFAEKSKTRLNYFYNRVYYCPNAYAEMPMRLYPVNQQFGRGMQYTNNEGVLAAKQKTCRTKASERERRIVMAITVQDLLEAGCHFGHQTKRWNPKMKDFVFGAKNGISIIDLTKTIRQIGDACNFLQRKVMNGSKVLFVGTKRQAQQIVMESAEATGMSYMAERWMGGTLTNYETIKKSIVKMREIDGIVSGESVTNLKKKEIALLERDAKKLHKDLDGIKDMKGLPDVIVIIDVCHDENAVKEANKLGIPIVAIVDTNSNPEPIDYPVAANDDAVKSIKIIMDTFVEAIKDAEEIYNIKAAEQKAKDEAAKAERNEKAKAADEKKKGDRPFAKRAPKKAAEGEEAKDDAPKADAPAKKPAAKKAAPKKEIKDLADLKKSDVAPKAE